MAATDVYLSLGTNLGNRERNIRIALNLLSLILGTPRTGMSEIIETQAVGFDGPDFLNCVVRYRTSKSPQTILSVCKRVEREMGRTDAPEYDADGHRVYHNRAIDIDILFYGKEHIDCEDLQVPHPLIAERDFVKIPLAEIAKPSLKAAFPEYFM